MNLLIIGAIISLISVVLMRNENEILNTIGMLILIIGIYIINIGRKQLGGNGK